MLERDSPESRRARLRATSVTMLKQSRRLIWRSRSLLYTALASVIVCSFLLSASGTGYHVVPWTIDMSGTALGPDGTPKPPKKKGTKPKGYNSDDYDDKKAKYEFSLEYNNTGLLPGAGLIYGNTLASLTRKEETNAETEATMTEWTEATSYSTEKPYIYNPYPKYESDEWKREHRADYVPCAGPLGIAPKDISVFKGRPQDFPSPSFGSYELLGIDPNLCYERETRLGPYGLQLQFDKPAHLLDWAKVKWGELQRKCAESNQPRFDKQVVELVDAMSKDGEVVRSDGEQDASTGGANEELRKQRHAQRLKRQQTAQRQLGVNTNSSAPEIRPQNPSESRTAILLRSYTGKRYTDNDKHVIRSLISEMSLRTGGEYQVFLLVQVKDDLEDLALWDKDTYNYIMQTTVPKEFHDITVLWGSYEVQEIYPKLEPQKAATVHNAQWLSVQKFMQEHQEFDYVWNWEMDSRLIGHHYDVLTKLGTFAKKQPRKGLWERNERFYIPAVHGDYDTDFRKSVEKIVGKDTIWGPPSLPFIEPIGPTPPVSSPKDDNYEWGVGEDADLITLSPIFDPVESNWILREQVWQYNDTKHKSEDLPRRTTIVTQSRLSRRLVETMHAENLRGNHVGSEMATDTVALLHGLKAVYAPMPVFFDRPWEPKSLQKWFNPGPKGTSGGPGSAMGWGREQRFQGSTWYYRAGPPQRLYNNWIGYEDNGIGGKNWEIHNGRPCLTAMLLHPIKDIMQTWPGYSSESVLPYD